MGMVGFRLRELRQSRNLTLKQVAESTGFAVSYLSQLERDMVSISVDNLEKLARFYGVRMLHFFQGIPENPAHVTRGEQVAGLLTQVQPGSTLFALLADHSRAKLEPVLAAIGPGHGDPCHRVHEAEVFLYVLAGQIQLHAESGQQIDLATGDSVCYAGEGGWRILNPNQNEPALLLMVSSPPSSRRDALIDHEAGVLFQTEGR